MYNIVKQDGFSFGFDSSKCFACEGNCCTGESGYIWCTPKEIDDMAKFLKMDRQSFVDDFIKKVGYKSSLKELKIAGSYNCLFFDTDKKQCQIYPVRPTQCRTFPFWDHFKNNIEEVVKECPGIVI
jgi:Fe-S-cluster containining protein